MLTSIVLSQNLPPEDSVPQQQQQQQQQQQPSVQLRPVLTQILAHAAAEVPFPSTKLEKEANEQEDDDMWEPESATKSSLSARQASMLGLDSSHTDPNEEDELMMAEMDAVLKEAFADLDAIDDPVQAAPSLAAQGRKRKSKTSFVSNTPRKRKSTKLPVESISAATASVTSSTKEKMTTTSSTTTAKERPIMQGAIDTSTLDTTFAFQRLKQILGDAAPSHLVFRNASDAWYSNLTMELHNLPADSDLILTGAIGSGGGGGGGEGSIPIVSLPPSVVAIESIQPVEGTTSSSVKSVSIQLDKALQSLQIPSVPSFFDDKKDIKAALFVNHNIFLHLRFESKQYERSALLSFPLHCYLPSTNQQAAWYSAVNEYQHACEHYVLKWGDSIASVMLLSGATDAPKFPNFAAYVTNGMDAFQKSSRFISPVAFVCTIPDA
jgi:hypothetical protein